MSKSISTTVCPKNIGIYIRVSTEKQSKNYSLEYQLDNINKFILSKGWSKVHSFVYKDINSASIPLKSKLLNPDKMHHISDLDSPGLINLIYDVMFGRIDTIISYYPDRFTRDMGTANFLTPILDQHNVPLYFVSPESILDSNNLENYSFIRNFFFILAEHEAELISSRVYHTNTLKASDNIWNGGKAPFGYELVQNPNTPKQTILRICSDASVINTIKKIFELYTIGYLPKHIAVWLNECNYYPNKEWTISAVNTILNNPIYTGYYVWGRRSGKRKKYKINRNTNYIFGKQDNSLAIITQEQWEQTKRLQQLQNKDKKYLSTSFLLKDILVCSECHCPLKVKNHGGLRSVYYCDHVDDKKILSNKPSIMINSYELHKKIYNKLFSDMYDLEHDKQALRKLHSRYKSKYEENIKNLKENRETLVKKLEITEEILNRSDKLQDKDIENEINDMKNEQLLLQNSYKKAIVDLDYYISKPILTLDEFREKIHDKLITSTSIDNICDESLKNRCLRVLYLDLISSIRIYPNKLIDVVYK